MSRDPVANSIREPVFDAAVGAAPVLRAVAAEAPRDPHAADVLTAFAGTRRAALRSRLVRVVGAAGRAVDDDSLDMAVDQVHGVLCTAC